MTNNYRQVYLFGDQTNDFESGLRRLFQVKDNGLLTSFFEKTNHALRQDITKRPRQVQEQLPRFTSLVDLLAKYRDSKHNAAATLESTLATLHQLGCFICYYGEASRIYPSTDSAMFGMCTGFLAASAAASALSAADLIPLAVDAVLVAFRAGLCVSEARSLLTQDDGAPESWSCVVAGLQHDAALSEIKEFSTRLGLPPSSGPYVSAVGTSSVTVSGPPRILDSFCRSPGMAEYRSVKVPIHAPYHASHLYAKSDMDAILGQVATGVLEKEARIPVISSETGEPLEATTFGALLRSALEQMLMQPIRWDKVLKAKFAPVASCTVFPVSSNAAQSLAQALRESSGAEVQIDNGLNGGSARNASAPSPSGRPDQSKIAIIGYSGRFPDAASNDAFWDLLHQGRDVHREVPPDRFNVQTHYDPTGKKKNTSQTPYGCFINEPGLFDARFFNLSPKEAEQSDPGQRLALLTAYEALEMAGFVPDATPSSQRDRVGMFYGMTSDDWREVNSGQNVGTYFIPGGNRAFTPGRINYHFKFSGPSVSIDTACSSSASAIHIACNSLWRNDCDTALAGGTNVMTSPDNFVGLDKGHFLSRTGNCKTFDDGADGYCRADAVGTVVLKRLEDAIADKDPILAVIAGAYTNHSAEAESITRPHVGAQSAIFRKVLNDAGYDARDVSYIEMHGTGTQAGDAVEMNSVLDVFANGRSSRTNPLYLGSAKSNIGHAESASGVASLIKVLLMMRESEIPRHCGIKTRLNTRFPADLADRGIRIAMQNTAWPRPSDGSGQRRAFLNNFSAAGGNSAMLLEDAPHLTNPDGDEDDEKADPRSTLPVVVSAKTPQSLSRNVRALAAHLATHPASTPLAHLSYTTTARRMHHAHRIAVSGTSTPQILSALEHAATRLDAAAAARPAPPRTAPAVTFAFTGQGSQYAAMGRALFTHSTVFRSEVQRLDAVGRGFGFASVMPFVAGSGDEGELDGFTPQVVQLGLTCVQLGLAALWRALGVEPAAVVGHSLGEYAALSVAGVLSAADAVYLVGHRARLLQERCEAGTHAMLVVKAAVGSVARLLLGDDEVEVACVNGPAQTVVAGPVASVERVEGLLVAEGVKATRLAINFAFHTAQVEPILDEFAGIARGVAFAKPRIPVISPLLGTVVTEGDFGADYLARHCREAVDLVTGVRAAVSAGTVDASTVWLEVGPQPFVTGMVSSILGSDTVAVPSLLRKESAWTVLAGSLSKLYLAGIDIRWSEYHRDFERCQKVLQLPSYQWDLKRYWIQYVNDWCLTKGDAPKAIAAPESKLSTITCQRIVGESVAKDKATVVVESDVANAELQAVFQAHKVNGAALCPSSVYADVALTLGDYLSKQNPIKANTGIEVADMATTKPLLLKAAGTSQLFRASADADWSTQTAAVAFYSVDAAGKKTLEHAKCTVRFGNPEHWLAEWKRSAYLVRSRIDKLRGDTSSSHKIRRGMAYRLFESLVEYGPRFRGIEQVVMDSSELEATACVRFQDQGSNFHANPYYIDSLGHISGFVMNANENADFRSHVFLNHGWQSIRCAAKLSPEKTYTTYVKMQPSDGAAYSGDVYVFEGDTIVGVNQGVAFQAVPRRVLDMLLPNPGAPKATTPASKPAPKAVPHRVPTAPQPKPSPAKQDIVAESTTLVRAMAIVADEIGCPVYELTNDVEFVDLGVDSLLSLTIAGRFREELDVELPSTFFAENPRPRDLKRFFCGAGGENSDVVGHVESTDSSDVSRQSTPLFSPQRSGESGASTPPDIELEKHVKTSGPMDAICAVLADEMGVSVDDLQTSSSLSELGLDSLMSLTVLGRLREEHDMDLPSDLLASDSIVEIQSRMGIAATPANPPPQPAALPPVPRATSVLLQGSPRTATRTLFLFPDGSGSATSYASLPPTIGGPSTAVIGLNCPFMRTPHLLAPHTLSALTPAYLAELRRRQPHGPYHLGGWSAGGISAYDAAQALQAEGEEVRGLVLLDSPFPVGLSKLPARLYAFFDSLNLFGGEEGGGKAPAWLMAHFRAFVDALARYEVRPFAPGSAPARTCAVWATDGVYRSTGGRRLEERPAEDTREMRWLLEDRMSFGGNGWEGLVGDEGLRCEVVEGANHFTMLKGERGERVARAIERGLGW